MEERHSCGGAHALEHNRTKALEVMKIRMAKVGKPKGQGKRSGDDQRGVKKGDEDAASSSSESSDGTGDESSEAGAGPKWEALYPSARTVRAEISLLLAVSSLSNVLAFFAGTDFAAFSLARRPATSRSPLPARPSTALVTSSSVSMPPSHNATSPSIG
jgi:hypothetical protein